MLRAGTWSGAALEGDVEDKSRTPALPRGSGKSRLRWSHRGSEAFASCRISLSLDQDLRPRADCWPFRVFLLLYSSPFVKTPF
jgi:hypothetical protein